MTTEEALDEILKTAATIANHNYHALYDVEAEERVNNKHHIMGDVFRPDRGRSEMGGLCLTMDESATRGRTKEEVEQMHIIATSAIKESIVEHHSKLFVGTVLGYARRGQNYFDLFPARQGRLF